MRMLGAMQKPVCPYCRSTPPGLDCPSKEYSRRQQRQRERRQWRRESRADG